ncbi:MAG: hypothetical protein ABII18_11545 [bacterium]|nr:hypothetical protein [bacterium]MBU1918746.1 hypothetical protein [bacterium]
MEIKSLKKVRRVRYSSIAQDDYTQRPQIKAPRKQQGYPDTLSYSNRRLYYEGQEIGELIRDTAMNNPQLLSPLANELEAFRKNSLKRRKKRTFWSRKEKGEFSDDDLGVIFSLCDAYIARISEFIKQRYDATTDGLSVLFDENNQLILNGMNIHAFLENCHDNLNEKSCIFLKGIRARLERVLNNKSNSRNFDRIQDVVLELFTEIDALLAKTPKTD